MRLTPIAKRAKERLKQHTVAVLREDYFRNMHSYLTVCVDEDCPNKPKDGNNWTGWFTDEEVDAVCDHDNRCCMLCEHHLPEHTLCPTKHI